MKRIIIEGNKPLSGKIKIGGAKNSVVALIPAAIMANGNVHISNVPNISDRDALIEILKLLNVKVVNNKDTMDIDASNMENVVIPENLSNKLRASYYFMGSLLARFKHVEIYFPGGCNIGSRPIDLHLKGFESLGATITKEDTKYIIDKYLEFIESIPAYDLDDASEYLVVAAELIHLKSRLLLNLDSESEDNDEFSINSEEDLKNKLIEYERYQNVTNVFKELEEKRNEFFTKLPENLNEFVDTKEKLEGNMDVELLKNALIELNKRMSYQKPINTRITRKEISVEERKEYIREFISKRKNVKFTDLFEEYNKDVVVATFLSILDMCKTQEITLRQDSNFGEIYIERVNV